MLTLVAARTKLIAVVVLTSANALVNVQALAVFAPLAPILVEHAKMLLL